MLRLVGMGAAPAAIIGVTLGLLTQPNWTPAPMGEIALNQAVQATEGPPPTVRYYPIQDTTPPPEPLQEVGLTTTELEQLSASFAKFVRDAGLEAPSQPEVMFLQTSAPVAPAGEGPQVESAATPLSPEGLTR